MTLTHSGDTVTMDVPIVFACNPRRPRPFEQTASPPTIDVPVVADDGHVSPTESPTERAPELHAAPRPPSPTTERLAELMTHTLVLLRHGESTWNAENLFTGWVDVDPSATRAAPRPSAAASS